MADPHVRGVFAEPYAGSAPMRFMGRNIPEFFTATFFVIDSDGIKVTNENFKRFKTIRYELLLRVTKVGTVEIVNMTVEGAKTYKGYDVITTKNYDPKSVGSVLPRHFNLFQEHRARFISVATQVILQSSQYKKNKDGGHTWTIFDTVEISETELQAINESLISPTYKKLDGTFYQEFATLYKELVLKGDKTPIKTLRNLYYPEKTIKHVQSYATTCRKKGLLPPAEQGRNSPIRKPREKKGR